MNREQILANISMLKRLGATRPMAPTGRESLVLGEFSPIKGSSCGHYQISYQANLYGDTSEQWFVNGRESDQLTEEQILAILKEQK